MQESICSVLSENYLVVQLMFVYKKNYAQRNYNMIVNRVESGDEND